MWIEAIIFIAILTSIALPGLIGVLIADRKRQDRHRRLMRAVLDSAATGKPAPKADPIKPRRTTTDGGPFVALDQILASTGLDIQARAFLLLNLLGVLVLAVLFAVVLGLPVILAVVGGGAAAGLASSITIRVIHARRNAAIIAHLPEALDAFARGLKAGRPVADALGLVVESTPAPLRDELARTRDMLSIGHDLAESLRKLAERVTVAEVRFFSVATQLQSETGGNLVETIENLADQLRQRRSMRKKIRALSAEARTSAIILSILPFAVAALLFVINPGYLRPLVADPRGLAMTGFGLLSLVSGMVVLHRMGRLDV